MAHQVSIPCLLLFPCSSSNSPPSSLDTHLGDHFRLGDYVLPGGSSTVEGNTIHMAANLPHDHHDRSDGLGNMYPVSGGVSSMNVARRLAGIAER